MSQTTTEMPAARARPPRRRRPALHQLVFRWLLVIVVLAVLALVAFRVLRSGSLPNIELAGENVGALDEDALRDRVGDIATRLEARHVTVRRPATDDAPVMTRSYARSELGYRVDVDATVEEILERGRQPNPLASFADHLTATFSAVELDAITTLDEGSLASWLQRVEEDLATEASPGRIYFTGGRVRTELPRTGVVVDPDALQEAAEEVVLDDDETTIEAPVEVVEPTMTAEQVRRAERDARRILSGPVTLTAGGAEARLTPLQISRALTTTVVDESRIEISAQPKALGKVAKSELGALSQDPSDANFRLVGDRVEVVPGRRGTEVDLRRLAVALPKIARSKDRTAPAPVENVKPEFTTADAKQLDIVEQVSTFTTYHSCCEPRVENIHRIADMIDGTVVKPGEEFSINDTVGQRTRGKGFIGAPAISNGEYVEEVGGGISQFATTIFNATFFGGYDFLEYKTHSYYISRYPMGREATVSWPAPDFRFLNDSDSGIYIDTSYSDTSITVTFYGRKERRVRSESGSPHDYTSPPTQCKENGSLRRGERRVVQTGSRGFDITVTRIFGDGTREEFDTTYLPVPEIIEKRKC